jgi:hypothetical protein
MKKLITNSFVNSKEFIFIVHFFFVIVFAACVFLLYYHGINDTFDDILYLASFILFCEIVALILNKGKCPLEHVHKRVGDDKGFFDRFIPKALIPYVIPISVIIIAIGFLLLYL